ncbi:MAG: arylsulfatase [Verrucomicrobiota bacterium]
MKPQHLLPNAALIAVALLASPAVALSDERPNIIFILVDDMGYSDLGCYGGEIRTPNIDRLARNGLRFTSMYNTSKCFPSRACLLTGVYAQQCGVGRKAGDFKNAMTIAELLKTEGYRTLAVGKHHSGKSLYDRGFDRFYGFHYGPGKSCANHFNPGEKRPGEGVPARKKGESRAYCFDDQKMLPYYTPKEKDWYTTDYFTKWAIDFLEEYKHEDKPYFLYVSYTAPHDPLHAWPEDIAKYEDVYDVGYASIREARYERQKELGLFGADFDLSTATHRSWSSLNAEQKQDQARRMQVYAAMIDRIDQNIGKLLEKIVELGEKEDTLVMFASDNGCSAGNVNTGTGEIGALTRWSSLQDDWANVSNSPFRLWKTLSHEGGIRTPFIAYWPKVISENGSLNHQPVHFVDVMATVQDITGATYPRSFKGEPILPMQRESLLPAFKGEQLLTRKNPIFFEYASGGAVREGDWKLVTRALAKKSKNPFKEEISWELYNIRADMSEMSNVAKENPEVVQRLSELWRGWYSASYEIPLFPDHHDRH